MHTRILRLLAALMLAAPGLAETPTPAPAPGYIIVKAARLVDTAAGVVRTNQAILIEGVELL